MSKDKKVNETAPSGYIVVFAFYNKAQIELLKSLLTEWNAPRDFSKLIDYTLDPVINGDVPNVTVFESSYELKNSFIPTTNPQATSILSLWDKTLPTHIFEYTVIVEPVINLQRMLYLIEDFMDHKDAGCGRAVVSWTDGDGRSTVARFLKDHNPQLFRIACRGLVNDTPNSLASANDKLADMLKGYGESIIHVSLL